MADRSYKLIYYDIRGISEPIRWMFRIAKVDFEDIRVSLDDWEEEREKFAKHVGQLPILCIDEKTELSQVHSITKYLAKQFGFEGETELDIARADEVVELLYDLRLRVVAHKQLFTSETPDIVRHTVFRDFKAEKNLSKKVLMKKLLLTDDIPKYLEKFDRFVQQSGGPFFTGAKCTYADLAFANFIDICEGAVNPDLLDDYPDLQNLVAEVFDIPEVSEWVEMTRKVSQDTPEEEVSIGA